MRSSSILTFAALSIIPALAFSVEDAFFSSLLKRQAPGTPAYECHNSCGTAITLSRGDDPCTDSEFLSDYAACLACAGPDDEDIWQYYGGTLTTAGTKCGLSVTPGEAEPAVTSSVVEAPTTTATASPESVTVTSTESVPEGTTTATSESGKPPTSSYVVGTITPTSTASSVSGGLPAASSTIPFTGAANSDRGGSFVAVAVAAIAVLGM